MNVCYNINIASHHIIKGVKKVSKIGYIRVSTQEQNLDRQREIMQKFEVDKVFEEKISGKDTNRPQFKAMLDYVREGDTLYIESYSRLARSTKDLLNIVDELERKGVNLVSDKENIDTSTPQGRLMFTIFSGLSQFERECTLERQREGIAIAKAQGKYKGKQPIKYDKKQFLKIYADVQAERITSVRAMELLGIKKTTYYKIIKQLKAKGEIKGEKTE